MKKLLSFLSSKQNLKNALEAVKLEDSFISFSINRDPYLESTQNRLVCVQGKKLATLSLGLKERIYAEFNNQDIEISNNEDFIAINKFFDRIYFYIIENCKGLLRPESDLTSKIDEESRSLEWLKVSLMVLKNALAEIKTKNDLVYQGRIFFGQKTIASTPELRIQCLSLDIMLEFLSDHRLRLRVWNLKDGVKTAMDKEDLFAEFVTLKGPVFDEIILLINEIRQLSFI